MVSSINTKYQDKYHIMLIIKQKKAIKNIPSRMQCAQTEVLEGSFHNHQLKKSGLYAATCPPVVVCVRAFKITGSVIALLFSFFCLPGSGKPESHLLIKIFCCCIVKHL